MDVRRIVPNLVCADVQRTKRFYTDLVGLDPRMDQGWVVGLASADNPTAQLQLFTGDATASVVPDVSIEVADVDALHTAASERGLRIVHPLTDEPWRVRRFFVEDPDGHVVNVLTHR